LTEAWRIEDEKSARYVSVNIDRLSKNKKLLSDKEVLQLLEDLIEESTRLDYLFKCELLQLRSQGLESGLLLTAIQEWLRLVHTAYWCPLDDSARIVFREVFTVKCQGGLHTKVETLLAGGKHGFTLESHLQPLANGRTPGEPPGDITVLYRLLECSSSRSVDVSDLCKSFCFCVAPSADLKVAQPALKHRFGYGLLTLHAMGLISPQSGGKTDGFSSSHWRLRKRHFGRVWLKSKDAEQDFSALCAAAPETAAEVALALRPDRINQESMDTKEIPAWAQRYLPQALRGDACLPSLLKRSAPSRPASGFDPAAKRAKGVQASRPRLFFG